MLPFCTVELIKTMGSLRRLHTAVFRHDKTMEVCEVHNIMLAGQRCCTIHQHTWLV